MIVAVIPAYNEASQIGEVVSKTAPFVHQVVVVDDGSKDGTAAIARNAGAVVVSHAVNRGLGGALGTGIRAALRLGAEIIITLDADGQHLPEEIPLFVEKIRSGREAVIGTRMKGGKGEMPATRKMFQWVGNAVTFLLFGLWTTDSQGGFRAFSKKGAERLDIRTNKMEVSSEIIGEIARLELSWCEVPITSVYTDYSLSKGQSFGVGIKTAYKLLMHRLKS